MKKYCEICYNFKEDVICFPGKQTSPVSISSISLQKYVCIDCINDEADEIKDKVSMFKITQIGFCND
jgi:hypothetical protein